MATWRDDKILELANQLSYSPAEKRREQLDAAIALVPTLDPAKTYPWDFVHFRITGFQSRTPSDHAITGKILCADLSTLIEFLSDTLSIKLEQAGASDTILSFEDISKKFTVSSKTIQRWRKQGLIALRYIYPDGRRRLGFMEASVAQFAADNKERLERSAAFNQISDEEKKKIIEIARRFTSHVRCSINEVSQRIARKLNRSPEAIRYTIRHYDREHLEAAIFPENGDSLRPAERVEIIQSFDKGMPIEQIAQHHALTQNSISRIVTQERAAKLKTVPIAFVPNPLFDHPEADNIILTLLPAEALAKAQATVAAGTNPKAADVFMARTPKDLPAFLADIFRQPVMPLELETDAFRRMNYLKYKAVKLQATLDADNASQTDLAALETLLNQANDIKNQLVQSTLRIAVHVARKHERSHRPLVELFSDATLWLMRAADNFDFARGGSEHHAKFSTYASYAIMKNFARDRADQLTRYDNHVLTGQEDLLNTVGAREAETPADHLDNAHSHADLLHVMKELPQREQELLTRHYGLDTGGGEAEPLSLSQIGDKMGITKARVRQLEARALRKLRKLLETRRENLHNATAKTT